METVLLALMHVHVIPEEEGIEAVQDGFPVVEVVVTVLVPRKR